MKKFLSFVILLGGLVVLSACNCKREEKAVHMPPTTVEPHKTEPTPTTPKEPTNIK